MCTLGGKCRAETKTVFVQFIMGHSPVTALLPPLSLLPGLSDVANRHPFSASLLFLLFVRTLSAGLLLLPSPSLSSPISSRAWGCSCETRSCGGGGLCHMANEEDDDFLTHFSQSLSWICCNQSQSSPIPLTPSLSLSSTPLPLKHDCKLECRGRRTDGRTSPHSASGGATDEKRSTSEPLFPNPLSSPVFSVCRLPGRRPSARVQATEGGGGWRHGARLAELRGWRRG